MAAYVIVDLDVKNEAALEGYRRAVPATVAKYGGRFLVRGGAAQTLEGGWEARRVVILEFESVERARAWYDSPEYVPLRRLRQSASEGRFILVEGI